MSPPSPAAVRTLTCLTPVSRHELFRFLADIENLPRWAAEFCSGLELSRGRWLAYTVTGEAFVELEADERSGTIDLRWGGEHGEFRILPLRVMALPGGQTLLSAVFLPGTAGDDSSFGREAGALAAALSRISDAVATGDMGRRKAG